MQGMKSKQLLDKRASIKRVEQSTRHGTGRHISFDQTDREVGREGQTGKHTNW